MRHDFALGIRSPSIPSPHHRNCRRRNRRAAARSAVIGIPVASGGDVPAELGVDRSGLEACGFTGAVGQALVLPSASGLPVIAVGVGDPKQLDASLLRDAAAALANAANKHANLCTALADSGDLAADVAAQAVVEGALLARYEYAALKNTQTVEPLAALTLMVSAARVADATDGSQRGAVCARVAMMARDLANSPPAHLTATRMAEAALTLTTDDLSIEVFDKEALVELGCGGLLGVNKGSSEPPRMIKLSYRPAEPPRRLRRWPWSARASCTTLAASA